MTDRNKQEQIETEVTCQNFSEFLQNTPPNQWVHISNLIVPQKLGPDPYSNFDRRINTPELELHCSDDSCNGVRFFRCTAVSDEGKPLKLDAVNYLRGAHK